MRDLRYYEPPAVPHECTAERDGDWVIFTCPHCDDYVRRMNFKTGEMPPMKSWNDIPHRGLFVPVGLQPEKYCEN